MHKYCCAQERGGAVMAALPCRHGMLHRTIFRKPAIDPLPAASLRNLHFLSQK